MATGETRPVGVIAGQGALPSLLVNAIRDRGRNVVMLTFGDGAQTRADTFTNGICRVHTRLGKAVGAMKHVADMGVHEVVMAGSLSRPSLSELRPDFATARIAARIFAKALGDDSLLRAVIKEVEKLGFSVMPIETFLSTLTAPYGVLGRVTPDPQAQRDIDRALDVARHLGAADTGQSVVVQQGIVLGVETIEGTDALLQRCGHYRRQGPGGVLVKIRKPGQDTRVDLPTIGPDTIDTAREVGLRGIAVEAGYCLIIDQARSIKAADDANLFLTGVTP